MCSCITVNAFRKKYNNFTGHTWFITLERTLTSNRKKWQAFHKEDERDIVADTITFYKLESTKRVHSGYALFAIHGQIYII